MGLVVGKVTKGFDGSFYVCKRMLPDPVHLRKAKVGKQAKRA